MLISDKPTTVKGNTVVMARYAGTGWPKGKQDRRVRR
jgi:hypothetical protein